MLPIRGSAGVLAVTTQIVSTGLLITAIFLGAIPNGTGVGGEQVLDTSCPIVIEERINQHRLETDAFSEFLRSKSFFGYTVSLAKGEQRQKQGHPTGWIYIGAPKSNLSEFTYGTDTEAGVIWRCSLGRKSFEDHKDSCEMMNIDPKPDSARRPESPTFESHIGAWIGGSLEIKHDRFVTCGSRWKRGKTYSYYNGICYWFAATTSPPERSSYCKSNDLMSLVNKNKYEHRLIPFYRPKLNDTIADQSVFEYFDGHTTLGQNPEWQVSQAGISVHLFLDYDSSQQGLSNYTNLLIGAPGARQWSGAVALYTNPEKPNKFMERPNRIKTDPTFSEFMVLHRGTIPNIQITDQQLYWNEYFGYSVSAGRYFDKNQVVYAAGAPAGNRRRGTVVIFDSPQGPKDAYKRQINSLQELEVPSVSKESPFGSYFGSVIHSVDLDGNGLDELVVGAPLYSFMESFTSEEPRPSPTEGGSAYSRPTGDHGCVFVYFKQERRDTSNAKLLRFQDFLVGSKSPKARFGSAISSIVFNLNDKTTQVYLVIGAPYEQSEKGSGSNTGAIYLYKSLSTEGKTFGRHSQRITASQISTSINGFGSSISTPEDADDNQTPDLAIGAFKSGHAVVLRSRPQILLKGNIKFQAVSNDKSFSDITEVQRGSKSFYVLPCFTIVENLGPVNKEIDIWVKIKFHDRAIQFDGASRQTNEITFLMKKVNAWAIKESCGTRIKILAVNRVGFGYENSSSTANSTKATPPTFTFYQEIWYNGTANRTLTVSKLYADTGRQPNEPPFYDFLAFNEKLPNPQFSKTEGKIPVSLSECSDSVCQPNLQMKWTFSYPNAEGNGQQMQSMSEYLLGQQTKEVLMHLIISNTNETALVKSIEISWNIKDVKESPLGTRWLHNNKCTKTVDTTISFLCNYLRYIRNGTNEIITIRWNMDDIFVKDSKDIPFIVNAQVNFDDRHINASSSSANLTLQVPKTRATISGTKRDNEVLRGHDSYDVTTLADIGAVTGNGQSGNHPGRSNEILHSSFTQRFTLYVQGASVNELTAVFKIPLVPNEFGNVKNQSMFLVTPPQLSSSYKENKTFSHINCTHPSSSLHMVQVIKDETTTKHRQRREVSSDQVNLPKGSPHIAQDMEHPQEVHKPPKLNSPENPVEFTCGSLDASHCIEITCKITNVRAKRHFHISFEMYPVKGRIADLLKTTSKSTLFVEASGMVSIFMSSESAVTISDSDVAQTILTQISGKAKPWLYVLAAGGGILLLALIVVGLYYCGFFKREKRQELNQMKAAHYRKSMIAAAALRGSVMVQSTGGGISGIAGGGCGEDGSRENLTEAVHYNEDMQIINPISKSTETIEEEVETEVEKGQ